MKCGSKEFGQGTRYVDLMNNDDVSGPGSENRRNRGKSRIWAVESEKEQKLSQSFGKLKMGEPILFYVIVFERGTRTKRKMSTVHEDWVLYLRRKLESTNSNTTRLALLYRKHVQAHYAIGKALCTMLEQIYWFN
jgi:hypothetical protein